MKAEGSKANHRAGTRSGEPNSPTARAFRIPWRYSRTPLHERGFVVWGRRAPACAPGSAATVGTVDRPTFDMSVLRAALGPDRAGHEDALRLLQLAKEGVLEVGVPPQGARADFRGDMTTPLAQRIVALLGSPGVIELQQLAVPSKFTFPAKDLSRAVGRGARRSVNFGIGAHWNGPGSKPGMEDRWYVESHVARRRDVLVTEDHGMQTMCRRLRDEHGFDITVESLADYAARFPRRPSRRRIWTSCRGRTA